MVAELDGKIVAILNSVTTNKEDISDEALKQFIGHDPDGKNRVVFALVVLPEYHRRGIASQLMSRFVEEARQQERENVLLLCKQHLIVYYERMGFHHVRLSRSTHRGAECHEICLTPRSRLDSVF